MESILMFLEHRRSTRRIGIAALLLAAVALPSCSGGGGSGGGGGGGAGDSGSGNVTPPAAPADVAVTPGDGQVTLSWTASAGATAYTIYYGTAATQTKASHENSQSAAGSPATVAGISNGVTYYFTVSATGAGGEGVESATASEMPLAPGPIHVVDAATGNDANPGTPASPFKTITKGLSVAVSGETVSVRPGTYDATNGETFPLLVPAGVSLLGDEPNKGLGSTATFINGLSTGVVDGAFVSLRAQAGAVIAGFKFTPTGVSSSAAAISLAIGNGVTVRNNTLTASPGRGIQIGSTTNHVIRGNTIDNNGIGILATSGVSGVLVESNNIHHNSTGVDMESEGVDFGGGAAGSAGGNNLTCSSQNDLFTFLTGATLYLQNNAWDHAPPNVAASFSLGLDIYDQHVNTVHTSGATVAAGACQ